jgi:thioesterase domain-containing protein/non-ribosomal peptide synthetase component F
MKNVEDLYPLAPLQEGLLFHALSAAGSSVGFEQAVFTVEGDLDSRAFERAWRRLAERNPVLRTFFVADSLEKPLQVVRRKVELPIACEDWRGLDRQAQEDRLADHLAADERRGFDLRSAPLSRVALFRTGDGAHSCVWSYHHLLFDGWCRALLLTEVLELYEHFAGGGAGEPPARRPYRDYIAWLQARDLAQAEAYWRQALRGLGGPTPIDLARPLTPGGAAVTNLAKVDLVEITLPGGVTGALKSFARRQGLTCSTLVQAAWALLLGHYSGREEVVFGIVAAGRPADLAGAESMLGVFVNNLPVRVRLSGDLPLALWLSAVQEQLAELRRFEYMPLARLQEWSGLAPDQRLFDSLVVYQNYPGAEPGAAAVPPQPRALAISARRQRIETGYSLTLVAEEVASLRLGLYYSAERFDSRAVALLLEQLGELLAGFAANARRRLRELTRVTAAERHALLHEMSPRRPAAGEHTVHRLFEEWAERVPEAPAVRDDAALMSYGDVNRAADRLARHLRGLGLRCEDPVAILVEPDGAMVVAVLAVLKAGGTVVWRTAPPSPAPRFAVVAGGADAGGAGALAPRARAVRLGGAGTSPPAARSPAGRHAAAPVAVSPSPGRAGEVPGDGLAFRVPAPAPDGGEAVSCGLPHRLLADRLAAVARLAGLGAGDTLLLDAAALEAGGNWLLLPLVAGASLALPPWREGGPAASGREGGEATALLATPASLEALVAGGWGTAGGARKILVHGGLLTCGLATVLLERGAVWRLYGGPEVGGAAAGAAIRAGEDRVTLGRTLGSATVLPLSADLELLPAGLAGRLVVRGDLFRGYLGRPELTAEWVVPDPFSEVPGGRLLRTRDIGWRLLTGDLEELARHAPGSTASGPALAATERRIALEVEAALHRHPQVLAASLETAAGAPRTVHILVDRRRFCGVPELRRYLRERLPGIGIPHRFEIRLLPQAAAGTPGGDEMAGASIGAGVQDSSVPPRDPLELRLVQIWEELFAIRPIGVQDSFFELGGHSLLAVRLAATLRAEFGRDLSLAALLQVATIEGLAMLLRGKAGLSIEPPLVAIQTRGTKPPLFLVHPSGGGVLCYVDLAYLLGTERPIYGLQAPGWDDDHRPLLRVEEMAAAYVQAIRTVRPHGPYLLAGWSFGGFVIYEMARQLAADGEEVPLLALLDTPVSGEPTAPRDDAALLAGMVRDHLEIDEEELRRLGDIDRQLAHLLERARAQGMLAGDGDSYARRARRLFNVARASYDAAMAFSPQPYSGRLVLLRAGDPVPALRDLAASDPTFGWGRWAARGVEVEVVPGNHESLVRRPQVEVLASRLAALLEPFS